MDLDDALVELVPLGLRLRLCVDLDDALVKLVPLGLRVRVCGP